MRVTLKLGFISLIILGGGCASVAPFNGLAIEDKSVYVSGVPPIRQDKHYACGAACLAAVAAYWNIPLQTFRQKRAQMPENATAADLQAVALELGLQAFSYRGSMDDLQENLHKGRPLIVMIPQPIVPSGRVVGETLINVWNQWGPKPAHWVVVLGLEQENAVIIDDPEAGFIKIKRPLFQAEWIKKSNLTVLVAPR